MKRKACEESGNNQTRTTQGAFYEGWEAREAAGYTGKTIDSEEYARRAEIAMREIGDELVSAKSKFRNNFVNQHEAYAVLLEEVEELWDEIKKNQKNYDLPAQRKEAKQAAAMLVRLMVELL